MKTKLLTGNIVKWMNASDSVRAPYMAERIIKHVELYRLLSERGTWTDADEIARVLKCSVRHARRLLEGFANAGYIELERGHFGGKGTVPTQARIKVSNDG